MEAELAASSCSSESEVLQKCGEFRSPQISDTAYVRCIMEAFHFILRQRKATKVQAQQVWYMIRL